MDLKIKILALVALVSIAAVPAMAMSQADCIVDEVAVLGSRVHVHCHAPPDPKVGYYAPSPFPWFALPTNSPNAVLFMMMGTAVASQNRFDKWSPAYDLYLYQHGGEEYAYTGKAYWQLEPHILHISYDEKDTSGQSFGCMADSCRMPVTFWTNG